jgi:hypothetical protein
METRSLASTKDLTLDSPTYEGKGKAIPLQAFTPRKYSWYSFLLEAELAPEP